MNNMFLMLAITIGIFAIGDILGIVTKAKLSSIFVALLLFLFLFMTNMIPSNIIEVAGLSQAGRWASPVLVFGMGTMINIKQLKSEWRTVFISVISMAVAILGVFLLLPLIGKDIILVAIPVLNGGIVATNIMVSGALEKGLPMAAAFGTLIYALQKFVGTPLASYYGLKEANLILKTYRESKEINEVNQKIKAQEEEKITFAEKNKQYFTPFVCFGIAVLAAYFGFLLQRFTGVNNTIWCLIIGAVLSCIGIVPEKILEHGKSSGFVTMAVFAGIIPSLAKISLTDLFNLSWQLCLVFGVLVIFSYIFMCLLPIWKIVGSRNIAMGIAMAQLLGFPATYLIAHEISTAVSQDEFEYELVMNKIAPAYVVSGLASVTTLSVLVAGICVGLL